MYDEYWDEVSGEFVNTDILIGYRVVSQTGAVLASGETREEALAAAYEAKVPITSV